MHAVLREREIREDAKKRDLAVEVKKLEKEKEILENVISMKKESLSQFRKAKEGPSINADLLKSFEYYLVTLEMKMREQDIRITAQNLKVLEAQKNLTEAIKRKKIINVIKEKEMDNYYKEMNKVEMKIIDDYNVLKGNYVKYS